MAYAARITGTGSAFPERVVTNEDIVTQLAGFGVETTDQWIQERTGIRERRIADENNPAEYNSALGTAAARKALDMAGKTPADIDQIIYATCTPDTKLPSSACWLQQELGAANAWATDINAACSGFVYGVTIADQFIRSGQTKTALVVGAEVLTSINNWEDRSVCILFGDGAGAAIIEQEDPDSTHRILSSHLKSDGSLWEILHVPGGGSRMGMTPQRLIEKLHLVQMNGKEVFKAAVRTLTDFAALALEANSMSLDDLDWFIPHQANYRIIEAVAKRLSLPVEKIIINLDRFGNTSSATVPTALDEAVRAGKIKSGHTILFDVFGAGLTYGSLMLRW
ncbi:MAG: beta-ketoacyl-ACP synthase III [Desulfobacterales bacterium]